MRRTALVLALLLACTACVGDDLRSEARPVAPRDGRGEPLLGAIAPAPGATIAPGSAAVKVESCAHRRRCP